MTSAIEPTVSLIQQLVHAALGGTVALMVDRSPGYSGSSVYAVDVVTPTAQLPCIVKLIPDWGDDEDWPDDVKVTNHVYGSRAASFGAAYTLLHQYGIPLPQRYAAFSPQPGRPYYCYIMARLPGEDVQTVRARLDGMAQAQLDALIGQQLGAIHRITRTYQGWVDLPAPCPLPWRDMFFTALYFILERACVHGVITQRRQQLVERFDHYAATWCDPACFVLSHADGLQGMMMADDQGWRFIGVIDIEDHYFTDPRFALAVYELSTAQAPLGATFWDAYQQHSTLDPTYAFFRPLFQLYVLLDWLGNVPSTQPETIDNLTQQIDRRCSGL